MSSEGLYRSSSFYIFVKNLAKFLPTFYFLKVVIAHFFWAESGKLRKNDKKWPKIAEKSGQKMGKSGQKMSKSGQFWTKVDMKN